MEKGKLIRLVEFGIAFILAFISFLLIITYGANDLVIIFLSAIVILTFLPVGLKFKDERENDIFHFKYYTPISLSIAISTLFLIITNQSNLSKEINAWLYFVFIIFILIYIFSHAYIKKQYPDYYFNS